MELEYIMPKIGSLIIDLEGPQLLPEEKELFAHPLIGGVILFARNYQSRQQLKSLCQSIRSTRSSPLLIMVDQEGGRVQRFIHEFTRLPPMIKFGELFDKNPQQACADVKECAWLMATELLSAHVDLSLAPVLDLQKNLNQAIGDRAFHSDPQTVIKLALAFIAGMREAGMAATIKHFPGHGSVQLDSHHKLPNDLRRLDEVEQEDMLPFTAIIRQNVEAVMSSHIIFPNIDSCLVSYSRYWLKIILREKLGFSGIVLSDDLNMEGANISSNYDERVKAAKEAGCDFTLVCNNRKGVVQVVDRLPKQFYFVESEKWQALQGRLGQALESERWQIAKERITKFNNEGKINAEYQT